MVETVANWEQLSEARAELETARAHLKAAQAELDTHKTYLLDAKASLEAAKLKYDDATKQLNAAKIQFEASKVQLDAAKSGLEDEKAKLPIKVSQLESDKSKLEAKVSQLENDKSQLESDKIQSKVEIQGLIDKMKELERQPNGKTMTKMIPARELLIMGSGQPEHWTWKVVPDSMYEVVELLNICWLELSCCIHTPDLTPNATYGIYLVFKLASNHYGFNDPPAKAYMNIQGGELNTRFVKLVAQGQGQHPTQRQDGWMEVELGQYYLRRSDKGYLQVCFREIDGGQWKRGLVLQGIEVRAK